MTLGSRFTRLLAVGVNAAIVAALAVAYLMLATTPASAQAIVVTVTPSTGLSDGQAVTVSGTGLEPNTVYHAAQCVAIDPATVVCNTPDVTDVTSGGDGTATTSLTVRRTFNGTIGIGGPPWGPVDCTEVQCFVGLGDDSGNGGGSLISFQ